MNKKIKDNEKVNKEISERLIQASMTMEENLLEELGARSEGLRDTEARERLDQYGKNQIAYDKTPAWYVQLLSCFKNPFILILLSLGLFAYFTGDAKALITITTMVTVSVLITFSQEFRSTRTAEKLKAMVKTTATVNRQLDLETKRQEIDLVLLVPGDIIHLSAGDMVPADIRLISSKDLHVGESALTGEAMPVEKTNLLPHGDLNMTSTQKQKPTNALDRKSVV
jgi:P-type Mg2+ transporter